MGGATPPARPTLQVLCIARSVQGCEGSPVVGETQFVLPPHASASSKLLYALHGLALPRYMPPTLWQPGPDEAAQIRRSRLAMTRDEWAVGTSGLAVPVPDEANKVLGTLGISLPIARLREREPLTRRLRDAASEVSWSRDFREAQACHETAQTPGSCPYRRSALWRAAHASSEYVIANRN